MLQKNKISSYILYGIGEIILVVIGILIAVSIDDQNNYRKERIAEKEILEEIVSNLESNMLLFESKISFFSTINHSGELLLQLKNNKNDFHDSLGIHFYGALVLAANSYIPRPAFEILKNKGFSIIQDKTLRREIVKLYDEVYPLTNLRFEDMKERRYSHLQQFIDENFWTDHLKSIPIDPDKTFNDPYFYSLIQSMIISRSQLSKYLEENSEETKRVLELIKASKPVNKKK